jgi:signal peptidase
MRIAGRPAAERPTSRAAATPDRTRTSNRRRVIATALLVLMTLGWWAFLRPSSMGGPLTFITVSGHSMEPGLYTGDLAVLYGQESYHRGDVVAYHATALPGESRQGPFVIHRIKGGDPRHGFVTRGDNNHWDDPWKPTADQVAGKMILSIPNVGVALTWVARPFNLAGVMAALMAGLVVAGGARKESECSPERKAEEVTS